MTRNIFFCADIDVEWVGSGDSQREKQFHHLFVAREAASVVRTLSNGRDDDAQGWNSCGNQECQRQSYHHHHHCLCQWRRSH